MFCISLAIVNLFAVLKVPVVKKKTKKVAITLK